MQFVEPGFIVDEAERRQVAPGPLRVSYHEASFFGHFGQVAMSLAVKIRTHRFNLQVHHVGETLRQTAGMAFFAPEAKAFQPASVREHLVGAADQFGHAVGVLKDADDMATAGDPDDNFIVSLKELPASIYIE